MIDLIFPDGSVRQYPQGSSGRDVATAISPSLAKRTLLVRLDGQLLDFDRPLPGGGKVEFVDRNDPDALDTIRHDTAHVLAEAVQELFPGTQVTIGPNVEDGFYYDFARAEPFSTDDFAAIEKRMAEIVDRDEKIVREVWERDKAIAHFKASGEQYKAEIIEGIPADQDVTLYRQGQWADLCRGPHLPSTKHVGKA
ncbi:MAG: TGS domain-containing protein, partial [Caulobacter sp.]